MKSLFYTMDYTIIGKMLFKGSFTLGVCLLYIQSVVAQYRDISKLIDDLQKGYRKDVLPTRTARSYVAVKVYPAIVRIDNLNAEREELCSTISLSLSWTDDRLSWDPRKYNGVTEVYMPASTIWQPDISVQNTLLIPEQITDQLVEVSSLGTILYVKNVHVRSYCHFDLKWFPRDQHTCELVLSSWIYSSKKMMLEFMHVNTSTTNVPVLADTDTNIMNIDSNKWLLRERQARAEINLLTYSCCPGESFFQMKIVMTAKRNISFIRCLTNMYTLPMLLISMLIPVQFLLPRKLSSRHIFGLTLSFGEFLPIILLSCEIPEQSSTPIIGIINILCIIIAMLALGVSIIVLKISDGSNKHLPSCLHQIIRLSCSNNNQTNEGEKKATTDNLNIIELDGLLSENQYIEMDDIACSSTLNAVINVENRRTNDRKGIENKGNNIKEATENIQRKKSENVHLILLRIRSELERIHASIDNELKRKKSENVHLILLRIRSELERIHASIDNELKRIESENCSTFASFLDKISFFVFMMFSSIIFIVTIFTLLL